MNKFKLNKQLLKYLSRSTCGVRRVIQISRKPSAISSCNCAFFFLVCYVRLQQRAWMQLRINCQLVLRSTCTFPIAPFLWLNVTYTLVEMQKKLWKQDINETLQTYSNWTRFSKDKLNRLVQQSFPKSHFAIFFLFLSKSNAFFFSQIACVSTWDQQTIKRKTVTQSQ